MVEWRAVVGFEGAYEVSNAGEVRSLARVVIRSNGIPNTVRPRTLKQTINSEGYCTVSLSQPGAKSVTHNVHVIVALAFHGAPPVDNMHVDHIDFDKTNNTIGNLRWLTPEENSHRYERDHEGTNTTDRGRSGTDLDWGFASDDEW